MRNIAKIRKIDLHMHTQYSDGTDRPEEILEHVKAAGIDMFSVTDHDGIRACFRIKKTMTENDPLFISGVEFSCKDPLGKYHILGYGYDGEHPAMQAILERGHALRLQKLSQRLEILTTQYGLDFEPADIEWLYSRDNPGKPHIANLLVKYKRAESVNDAFDKYLNHLKSPKVTVYPEEAIAAILASGGIPILAHPCYGSGNELILDDEMDERLKRLMGFGIRGVEAYYSGFTPRMENQILSLAEKYDLYVTAGSDYHGSNKLVRLGKNNLADVQDAAPGLKHFLEEVPLR